MKKLFKTICLIAILTLLVSPQNGNVVANSNKISEKRNQLSYIRSQIEKNQIAIEQINQQSSQLMQEVYEIDSLIQLTTMEVQKIENEIRRKHGSLLAVERAGLENQKRLQYAKQSFDNFSKDITGGEQDYWEWSIDTDSAMLLNLRLNQLNTVYNVYNSAVYKNQKDGVNIKAQEGLLQMEKSVLERNRNIVVQKQELIQDQYNRKATILNGLISQKNAFSSAIDDLAQTEGSLTSAIKRLQSYGYSSGKKLKKGKGVMAWPAEKNAGRVTSEFGYRIHPIYKTKKLHTGLDIGLPTGEPVLAAADGIVISSGWISGFGNTVIIDHGDKISTLYAHNSKLTVSSGDEVKTGDKIAEVGSTGLSTGPHIHFEVRVDGEPQDPEDWL